MAAQLKVVGAVRLRRVWRAYESRRRIREFLEKTSHRQRGLRRVGGTDDTVTSKIAGCVWEKDAFSNAGYTTILFTLEPEEIFQTALFPSSPFFYLLFSVLVSLLPCNSPTCSPSPPPSFTSYLSGSSVSEGRVEVSAPRALHYHL